MDSAYPAIKIASSSRAIPMPGHLVSDEAEDGTFYDRRMGPPRYELIVDHSWIQLTDHATLVAAFDSGEWQIVPVNGRDYRARFVSEPQITKRSGPKVMVRSTLRGNRYGW